MSAVRQLDRLEVRQLGETDLDRLAVIERCAYQAHGWSRAIFADCLGVGYDCWGVVHEGVLVGYGIFSVAVGESHLLNLAVHPDSQGRGIGRFMLDFVLREAARRDAECMFLEVRPSNRVARALYAAAGFNEFGRRRGYYPNGPGGVREDALIFCRRLR